MSNFVRVTDPAHMLYGRVGEHINPECEESTPLIVVNDICWPIPSDAWEGIDPPAADPMDSEQQFAWSIFVAAVLGILWVGLLLGKVLA